MTGDLTLSVAGVIGPVVHGQGSASGRRTSVIQLGGCNLACSWCDSAYTWDAARYDLRRELEMWTVSEIAQEALACRPSTVVISGGEPLMQQGTPAWPYLLAALSTHEIGLETNGTIAPSEQTLRGVSWITVSPKLAHSGDPARARINSDVLVLWGRLARRLDVDFSVVVQTAEDIATVSSLVRAHGLPRERVWVSPEGTRAATVLPTLQEISGPALEAGFNISPRLNALMP
ncbi:7-carboxy-7-deazaguanine synthase QueE [Kineosporia babensis]|uniref:7-carboxy-7-deazaguanine synthase n=1 Tax=Kineosporia babensis TaxID=499548 RepID=A0A9X1SU31_9ACTN|nr:7-carboxy-7-deazaguanine synthase QueE [Kineosporia babensis]MCD5312519.1 7-carboxy-7-deazaguanine synthase QueE [Kineosporia babensis]